MKLLFLTPYVYAPEYKEHRKNKTGFGFMVYDIASSVGKLGNQVILATHAFGPERSCDGFRIAANGLVGNILYGHYKGIGRYCLKLKKNGIPLKNILRGAYYYLNIGFIAHLIKKTKPNVVHIHGCSIVIEEIISMLRTLNIPYIVTMHGLLQDDPSATNYHKNCERKFVKDKNTTITVISSTMKIRFLSGYYNVANTGNVHVITNGVETTRKNASCDIREKHGIPADKKVLLSVGSVCMLKNQNQTVRAFAALPKKLREQCVLLFAGVVYEDTPILEEIKALGLEKQILCLGFVPREELCDYYHAADLTVTASKTEGFGLPIVEGFVYGVPCVAFSDLDAIGDVYDDCAMLLCRERSDEALAESISKALTSEWDRGGIQEHSKKYSLEEMAKKYCAVYQSVVKK